MAIITDGVHLVSTESEQELHKFAQGIGLKRKWYQCDGPARYHPHYDLTTKRAFQRAVKAGAERVSSRDALVRAWWWERHPLNGRLVKSKQERR